MGEMLPILILGAIIGVFSLLFILAYVLLKRSKPKDFDRHMKDGEIVRRLMDAGVPAPRGGKTWHIEAIRRILTNEKYYGDVCLQKTYIADFYTGKQLPNRGERDCYLLRDHHTAIIPKCQFNEISA